MAVALFPGRGVGSTSLLNLPVASGEDEEHIRRQVFAAPDRGSRESPGPRLAVKGVGDLVGALLPERRDAPAERWGSSVGVPPTFPSSVSRGVRRSAVAGLLYATVHPS
jgi:hypothetical protein